MHARPVTRAAPRNKRGAGGPGGGGVGGHSPADGVDRGCVRERGGGGAADRLTEIHAITSSGARPGRASRYHDGPRRGIRDGEVASPRAGGTDTDEAVLSEVTRERTIRNSTEYLVLDDIARARDEVAAVSPVEADPAPLELFPIESRTGHA